LLLRIYLDRGKKRGTYEARKRHRTGLRFGRKAYTSIERALLFKLFKQLRRSQLILRYSYKATSNTFNDDEVIKQTASSRANSGGYSDVFEFAVGAPGIDSAAVFSAAKPSLFLFVIWFAEVTFLSAGAVPPSLNADFETTVTSGRRLSGDGLDYENVSSSSFTTSLLRRWQIGNGKWYQGIGLKAERFSFTPKEMPLPSRLQDYAALISLERFEDDTCVAALTLSPGWYFEKHVTRSAWDIPFEAFSGIPISSGVNGVLGLSNGRFYHHAVPIAGIVWQVTPQARLEAIYPAPALVITSFQNLVFRLGGELYGGGFRTDTSPDGKGVVEYDSYRIGAAVTYSRRSFQLTFGAGVEAERNFDFFRQGQRLHGGGAGYGKFGVEWMY